MPFVYFNLLHSHANINVKIKQTISRTMKNEVKMLMSFIVDEEPEFLVSPCEEELISNLKEEGEVWCTARKCESKHCIELNPEGPYLPRDRFSAWIVDVKSTPLTVGYVFHLASHTLKNMAVLAIKNAVVDDSMARGYGFEILHHGSWHYYLKSEEKSSTLDL